MSCCSSLLNVDASHQARQQSVNRFVSIPVVALVALVWHPAPSFAGLGLSQHQARSVRARTGRMAWMQEIATKPLTLSDLDKDIFDWMMAAGFEWNHKERVLEDLSKATVRAGLLESTSMQERYDLCQDAVMALGRATRRLPLENWKLRVYLTDALCAGVDEDNDYKWYIKLQICSRLGMQECGFD